MLQLVYETGILNIECSQPNYLMRDFAIGGVTNVEPGANDTGSVFHNEVTLVEFDLSAMPTPCEIEIFPDNYPVKAGCFLLESGTWAAYHTVEKIQVIGLKGDRIFIFTRPLVYHMDFGEGLAPLVFKELCACVIKSASFHVTQFPPDGFWASSQSRWHAVEVIEDRKPPDKLGGMDSFMDFRKTPQDSVGDLAQIKPVRRSAPDNSMDI